MLKFAYEYKSEIQKFFPSLILDKRYENFFCNAYSNLEYAVKDSEWDEHHFVSVDKDNRILGCIKFMHDRVQNTTSASMFSMFVNNIKFYNDILNSIDIVFNKGFRRIDFNALSDSSVEKLYNKFVKIHGGRRIGYRMNEYYLNCKYRNQIMYEIMKEEYHR